MAVESKFEDWKLGQRLNRAEAELYRRCDEVLHYVWDPIGVSGAPPARDEYDAYLPQVFGLLKQNAPEQDIAAYLLTVERERMGLPGNVENAGAVASVLVDWRVHIAERFTDRE